MTTDNNKHERVANLEVISGSSVVLHFAGRDFSATIGKNGVQTDKREGDGATPSGLLTLRRILYRSDRLNAPNTSLLCESITKNDGWCDDVTHPDYNRQIHLPHPASHEKLWLEDQTYDIIGILGYNDDPIIPGRGSAIFLHIVKPTMIPTDGCIALSLDDLRWILEHELEAIHVPN